MRTQVKEKRETAFKLWQSGMSQGKIAYITGINPSVLELWLNHFETHGTPYNERLPKRKCNLCPQSFSPENKFERFCRFCKGRARQKEQTEYGFLPK